MFPVPEGLADPPSLHFGDERPRRLDPDSALEEPPTQATDEQLTIPPEEPDA